MGDSSYKARHKAAGLCVDCSRPALPGRTRCAIHSITHSQQVRRWYAATRPARIKYHAAVRARRRAEGRCIICGAPLRDPTMKSCANCIGRITFCN